VDETSIRTETRAGDPFHAKGVRLLAALLSSEECSECGISLDVWGGEGIADGERWLCEDCATLPERSWRSQ